MKKALVLCLLATGCAHAPLFPSPDFATLPERDKYPDADRVVLLDEKQVRYFIDPLTQKLAADVTEHNRVRLFRPGAITWVGQHYSRTFESVTSFKGQLVTPSGEVRPFDPGEKRDVPSIGSSVLFSDSRQLQWNVPVGPAGSVLEWETVTHISDTKPYVFPNWLGDSAPAKQIRHVVVAPNGWEVEWVARRANAVIELPPRIETGPTETTYTWEATDTPMWKTEVWGGSFGYDVPHIAVRLKKWKENGKDESAFASATALSQWLYGEYQNKSAPSADMKDLVAAVLKGVPDEPRAKAKKLYEWACEEVQYCAIEIGYGGWVPHAAQDVHSNRYGDCKDKANYLRALLDIAGVKSHPTLIDSHSGLAREFEMPALGANFNHAILAVELPGETLLVDPTERAVPFGQLPPRDQDSTVLAIAPNGAEPGKSPVSTAEDNANDIQLTADVKTDGSATGTFVLRAKGANALGLKQSLLLSEDKPSELVKKWLHMAGLKINSVDKIDAAPFAEAIELKGTFTLRNVLAVVPGSTTLLRMEELMPSNVPVLPDDPRRTPFVRQWLNKTALKVTLNLPTQATVSRLPAETKIDHPHARYALNWAATKGALVITRAWETKQRVTPTAQVAETKKFFEAVHRAEANPALISFAAEKTP